jgi:hypothetical protein
MLGFGYRIVAHEARLFKLPLFDVGVAMALIHDLLARAQRHAADFLSKLHD